MPQALIVVWNSRLQYWLPRSLWKISLLTPTEN
jgi:hypothetical protein